MVDLIGKQRYGLRLLKIPGKKAVSNLEKAENYKDYILELL